MNESSLFLRPVRLCNISQARPLCAVPQPLGHVETLAIFFLYRNCLKYTFRFVVVDAAKFNMAVTKAEVALAEIVFNTSSCIYVVTGGLFWIAGLRCLMWIMWQTWLAEARTCTYRKLALIAR